MPRGVQGAGTIILSENIHNYVLLRIFMKQTLPDVYSDLENQYYVSKEYFSSLGELLLLMLLYD